MIITLTHYELCDKMTKGWLSIGQKKNVVKILRITWLNYFSNTCFILFTRQNDFVFWTFTQASRARAEKSRANWTHYKWTVTELEVFLKMWEILPFALATSLFTRLSHLSAQPFQTCSQKTPQMSTPTDTHVHTTASLRFSIFLLSPLINCPSSCPYPPHPFRHCHPLLPGLEHVSINPCFAYHQISTFY